MEHATDDGIGSFATNTCIKYCVMQQPFAMGSFATNPCMKYCMMQQPFSIGSFALKPCMQYCRTQQPFSIASSFASPAPMPLQQYWTQTMKPSTMSFQQCHYGAISQVMLKQQLPFTFNPMVVTIWLVFF